MNKTKLTINRQKDIEVDIKTDQNIVLSQNTKNIKCSILQSKVEEQIDFFIFKTKLLIFRINTKTYGCSAKLNWTVKRFEADFYTLRNILTLSYG